MHDIIIGYYIGNSRKPKFCDFFARYSISFGTDACNTVKGVYLCNSMRISSITLIWYGNSPNKNHELVSVPQFSLHLKLRSAHLHQKKNCFVLAGENAKAIKHS